MNLRSLARSLIIQAATRLRLDELGLHVQGGKANSRGIVVAVHETPKSSESRFREQLNWVTRYFTIATLETFAQIWGDSEQFPRSKPPVLFTFDDGRESNYLVAAPLLESLGGRGVFFIVPAFADCPVGKALGFYRSRINPNSRSGDEEWEDWKPMNSGQIADLAARGHAIGNHTLTHERLVGLSHDDLEREIGDSARKLLWWTKKPVDAFAWTFGWDALDARAWEVIRRHHRFCFAPCAGVVDGRRDNPGLIWRREVEVKYSAAEYRFLYSGLADLWWNGRRRRLRKMFPSRYLPDVEWPSRLRER